MCHSEQEDTLLEFRHAHETSLGVRSMLVSSFTVEGPSIVLATLSFLNTLCQTTTRCIAGRVRWLHMPALARESDTFVVNGPLATTQTELRFQYSGS